jgi:hypothetical protein
VAAFSSLAFWVNVGVIGGRRRPFITKRPRGRPRKPKPTLIGAPLARPRGAPRQHDVSDEWLVGIVTHQKAQAREQGRGDISDRRAIAELIFEAAATEAVDIRRQIEASITTRESEAETEHARAQAFQRAVAEFEGERLTWWVQRLDRARRTLRKARAPRRTGRP